MLFPFDFSATCLLLSQSIPLRSCFCCHEDAVRSLSKLWLDLNDRNLSLEPVDDDENGQQLGLMNGTAGNRHWGEGAIDPFNISNDKYYFYGNTVRGRRVDRQSVLRGTLSLSGK